MRLTEHYEDDEYDQTPDNRKMIRYVWMIFILAIIAIIAVVFAINYDSMPRKSAVSQKKSDTSANLLNEVQAMHESVQKLVTNDGLTSDQLDFWDIYQEEKETESEKDTVSGNKAKNKEEETEKKYGQTDAEADHVNQTMIQKSDGTEEWVNISPFITKNKYDEKNFEYKNPVMKYYDSGKCISYLGVDISKETGKVDFNKLKKAGIQFVIIQAGARGYGTGQLLLDDNFLDNMQAATEAGLDIGVSFFSQAVTKEEALEEANLVYENIKEYLVTYPIAFDMEKIPGDIARTDRLTREEKSNIALTFLDALKGVGYKGIIYGNKEWLIKEINLSTVGSYDIWLSQEGKKPDYPYKYSIWQYTQRGNIDGINGDANLDICFINYKMK